MFEEILNYIVQYGPAVLAMVCEAGIVKFAISALSKAMKSKEFKEMAESNKALAQKVDDQNEKINQLMDKIGRIHNDGQQSNKEV